MHRSLVVNNPYIVLLFMLQRKNRPTHGRTKDELDLVY
jgi:hypothetical protein